MRHQARLVLATFLIITFVDAHWWQHYRYAKRDSPLNSGVRNRRQGVPQQEIDLNITVPFIFSARLYPYGTERGDNAMDRRVASQAIVLRTPISFVGGNHSTIFILRDGAIGFEPGLETVRRSSQIQTMPRVIAPFWTPTSLGNFGNVYFRETQDRNVLNLAKSEVQIQYRYGEDFRPTSVLIITWENMAPSQAADNLPVDERNLFQLALILSDNGTFAHMVYSKLRWNDNALAGFNAAPTPNSPFFAMPGSGTRDAINLANISDIGIPGEWLFKLDEDEVHLCGPGYHGLECIEECKNGHWSYDCGRRCHCAGSRQCDVVKGVCPNGGQCKEGWSNAPICDQDIDECALMHTPQSPLNCPPAQPHCINTLGAFVCTCNTGYDEETNRCVGTTGADGGDTRPQFVEVVPIQPQIVTPRFGVPRTTPVPNSQRTTARPGFVQSVSFAAQLVTDPPTRRTPDIRAPSTTNFGRPPTTRVVVPSPTTSLPPHPRPIVPQIVSNGGDCTCGDNAHCVTDGRGSAECICDQGFSGDGQFCVDINECFMENECGGQSRCSNLIGSYTCLCDEGYESDGFTGCRDVDECATGEAVCSGGTRSTCVNTDGGYDCHCADGFNGSPNSIVGCVDVDECLVGACGEHAQCTNLDGSYDCACLQGYGSENGTCTDVDECLASPCHQAAVCTNTQGSYTCNCITGFSGDGLDCEESILFSYDRNVDQQMPRERDAAAELPLRKPMRVFGKVYDKVFISINGMVTFDNPLLQYTAVPLSELSLTGLAPFYMPTDVSRGGVFVRQPIDSQGATADYAALTRASLNVEQDFKKSSFIAQSVLIVTYDNVLDRDRRASTVQLVLAWSGNETYATYIYGDVQGDGQAGVLTGRADTTLALDGGILRSGSNIEESGRWMFRIDEPTLIACPSGRLGAPHCTDTCPPGFWGLGCGQSCRCAQGVPCDFTNGFCANRACQSGFEGPDCQFDIDECSTQRHECSVNAVCTNMIGSYECRCGQGFSGNGRDCEPTNACLARFGQACHSLANCVIDVIGQAQCSCPSGTQGNGFDCQPFGTAFSTAPIAPVTTVPTTQRTPPTRAPTTTLPTTRRTTPRAPPTTPFSNELPRKPETTTKQTILTNTNVWPERNDVRVRTPATTKRPPPVDQVFSAGNAAREADDDDNTMSNLLVIVIPSVLCGVWLILIAVLLCVCIKKRRAKRAQAKHGLSFYMAPNGQQPGGNIPAIATAKYTEGTSNYSTPQPGASASGASPSGPLWAIPRPNYDYYQSAYYPYGQNVKY